jgi:hypothetical protein
MMQCHACGAEAAKETAAYGPAGNLICPACADDLEQRRAEMAALAASPAGRLTAARNSGMQTIGPLVGWGFMLGGAAGSLLLVLSSLTGSGATMVSEEPVVGAEKLLADLVAASVFASFAVLGYFIRRSTRAR